ncbi:MAG: hypothetical protein J6T30_00605 [Bacteroidales bacterium]|nr:hypothetical protein [Bacteroidales bacterium]
MTNEVIAAQVADSMVGAANSMYPTIYDAIMAAFVMKDKQQTLLCNECIYNYHETIQEILNNLFNIDCGKEN